MLEKEFIPYEQALELKELDFDEPCFCFWRKEACNGNPFEYNIDFHTKVELDHNLCPKNSEYSNDWISSPTYSQVFRWFREQYKLHGIIAPRFLNDGSLWYVSEEIDILKNDIQTLNNNLFQGIFQTHKTYEDAELACLKKLIKIVKTD